MKLRTRFAVSTALVGATVALAAAVGGQLVVARQLRQEIDQGLLRRTIRDDARNNARFDVPNGGLAGQLDDSQGSDRVAPEFGTDGPHTTDSGAQAGVGSSGVEAADGSGRSRRRGTAPSSANPIARPDGRMLTPIELQTLMLNRRCLTGRRGDAVILVQLISADGTVESCLGGQRFPVDAADRALAARGTASMRLAPRLRTVTVGGDDYRLATIAGPFGATQWVRELGGEAEVLRTLRWRFLLLGLGATLLAALAGWLLAARFLRPIHKLRSATDRVAETQNLSEPVDTSGDDEIGSLGRSFNAMIAALATSREQQQRLILDASHELRTPLTSLRTNIEMANRSRRLSDDDNREVMGAALAEVQELTTVISELVELATDRTADEALVPVHLVDLANDVAERTRRRSNRSIVVTSSGLSSSLSSGLSSSVSSGLSSSTAPSTSTSFPDAPSGRSLSDMAATARAESVLGRPRMLERAIANLVENAVKYSTPDSPIIIEVSRLSVTVVDAGPGIDAKDLPHIFDRFYRSDQARSAQGSGLGLAIVRQIIERHGGDVVARINPNGGAAVGFILSDSL
jgi:two-component system, OmpR family, sensor histidine kinase MprB